MFTKKYFGSTECAIRPEIDSSLVRVRCFYEGTEILKDAYFRCRFESERDRLDLLFGKHTTVHKTQNLAENLDRPMFAERSRSRSSSELRGDLFLKGGGLQQIFFS